MSSNSNPVRPSSGSGGTPAACATAPCPLQPKSIHIDIGWTFSGGAPTGSYNLTLNGQNFTGLLNNGQIRIDRQLNSITGSGTLRIIITDGPTYRANVELGMPAIQSPAGLVQRLTNLGFYAGTDGIFDGRARWAIRAFKRVMMNGFTRNQTEAENNQASAAFLAAVQNAFGAHPNDVTAGGLVVAGVNRASTCEMFGSHTLKRGSFEMAGARDDRDPTGAGNTAIWEGASAAGEEPIAGVFSVYLRAFDPTAGELPISNRVNLPQHIHMVQLVLFELGYWLVGGNGGWTPLDGSQTRNSFTPDGGFGRNTQWALREFQCHAKMANGAMEDVDSIELRYLPRLFAKSPAAVTGNALYPAAGRVSGALNPQTRNALQAWADGELRCPVIVYASTDNANAVANGSDLSRLVKENLWGYDDHANNAPRMYVIDYSQYYSIPAAYGGTVNSGTSSFPRPIVVGQYVATLDGGPVTLPPRHIWSSADSEVRPDTMIGTGGLNGVGLSASQLSTFKVVRTAAHFECLGYFDVLNAYDDVTISFGPCHWTLARCSGTGSGDEAREMPAFLAYLQNAYAPAHETFFGMFGLEPQSVWPLTMAAQSGTYSNRMTIQTESDRIVLCGVSNAMVENKYCKNWHVYYRFQMACRTSTDMRRAMWDFSRIRVRDILDKSFMIAGAERRVGDYVTSEKGVAMLLRWHIFRPAHLFKPHITTPTSPSPNRLRNILATVIAAHPAATPARETAMLQQLSTVGGPPTDGHLTEIYNMTNVPQTGARAYYRLNLDNPTLNATLNSFNFEAP